MTTTTAVTTAPPVFKTVAAAPLACLSTGAPYCAEARETFSRLESAAGETLDAQMEHVFELARLEHETHAETEAAAIAEQSERSIAIRRATFADRVQRVFRVPDVYPDNEALNEATIAGLRITLSGEDVYIVEACEECGGRILSQPLKRGLRDIGAWKAGGHRQAHEHPAPPSERLQSALDAIAKAAQGAEGGAEPIRSGAEALGLLYGALDVLSGEIRRVQASASAKKAKAAGREEIAAALQGPLVDAAAVAVRAIVDLGA